MNIATFDFDSQDTLFSDDLPDMIVSNHLNPDFEGINLRHIFGSATEKDTRYNNPRAWYIQKQFSETASDPLDQDLPFICLPKKENQRDGCKVGVEQSFSKYPFMIRTGMERLVRELAFVRLLSIAISKCIFSKCAVTYLMKLQAFTG